MGFRVDEGYLTKKQQKAKQKNATADWVKNHPDEIASLLGTGKKKTKEKKQKHYLPPQPELSFWGELDEKMKNSDRKSYDMLTRDGYQKHWQNTGAFWGGGYHTAFTKKAREKNPFIAYEGRTDVPISWKGKTNLPGPGPRLLFNTTTGIITGYTEDGEGIMINDSADMKQCSTNLKKVKGYGEGPLLMTRTDGSPGSSSTIAFASGLAGHGWMPVQCNNTEQYEAAFGGLNQLGKGTGDWEGGDKDTGGLSKSNLAGDIFANDGLPVLTADDKASKTGQNLINMGFNMVIEGIKDAGEAIAGMATGGLSEIAFAVIDPLTSKLDSDLADEATKEFTAATGLDKAMRDYGGDFQQMFDNAVQVGDVGGKIDANFVKDERIRVEKIRYKEAKDTLDAVLEKQKTPKEGISEKQQALHSQIADDVQKALDARKDELAFPEYLENDSRDMNLDVMNWSQLSLARRRMEYAATSVNSAAQALETHAMITKFGFHPSVNQRTKHFRYVMDNILPPKTAGPMTYNETLKNVVAVGKDMNRQFYADQSEKQEKSSSLYEATIDSKLGLDGDMGHQWIANMLTPADYKHFDELVKSGQAEQKDLYDFQQDKMRAYRDRLAGTKTMRSSIFDIYPEYKKFFNSQLKRDKKTKRWGKFFPELSDEEFSHMQGLEKTIGEKFHADLLKKYPDKKVEDWKKTRDKDGPADIPKDFTKEEVNQAFTEMQKTAYKPSQTVKEWEKAMMKSHGKGGIAHADWTKPDDIKEAKTYLDSFNQFWHPHSPISPTVNPSSSESSPDET